MWQLEQQLEPQVQRILAHLMLAHQRVRPEGELEGERGVYERAPMHDLLSGSLAR